MYRITEMPYLLVDGKDFDLELENFNTGSDFIEFLHQAYMGETLLDKYGNEISLFTQKQKQDFSNQLKSNPIFKAMTQGKFTVDENKLINIILNY